ncbi:hypothetical protein ACHAW5_001458 [Stephanodiscus triporus]|uniref:Uncharacterized protein n=1 Tax=Stephanodiscus triporus TaxID=2934178 RepID=A0ABD3N6T1_9STRA
MVGTEHVIECEVLIRYARFAGDSDLMAFRVRSARFNVSGKARLDRPHEVFEGEMERLYANVRKVERPCSRLRSPNVFVIVADGKR